MAKIYLKDKYGNKVTVEVTDDVAENYRDSLREEWRSDAYEKYYTQSLNGLIEAGRDFEDGQADTEGNFVLQEEQQERLVLMKKLKIALPHLTDLQRWTLHKLFVLNMTQSEIAREEGVTQQVVNRRVARIFNQLRKLIEKN